MKNKIIVSKLNDRLHFYLISNGKRYYLFTQDFSKGVYQFFRSGRSESELHKYNLWRKNPDVHALRPERGQRRVT